MPCAERLQFVSRWGSGSRTARQLLGSRLCGSWFTGQHGPKTRTILTNPAKTNNGTKNMICQVWFIIIGYVSIHILFMFALFVGPLPPLPQQVNKPCDYIGHVPQKAQIPKIVHFGGDNLLIAFSICFATTQHHYFTCFVIFWIRAF